MAATHAPLLPFGVLPPPLISSNPYSRLPRSSSRQPLPSPLSQFPRSDPLHHLSFRHGPDPYQPQHSPPSTQNPRQKGSAAAPLDRILQSPSYELTAPSIRYSPSAPYAPQPSSHPQSGSDTSLGRPHSWQLPNESSRYESSGTVGRQPNDAFMPSPSYFAHRQSMESHQSSGTSSSGGGSIPAPQPDISSALSQLGQTRCARPSNRANLTSLITYPIGSTSRYQLSVRQQPLAARACGFGERDRRVVDPPPIVQLSLKDFDSSNPSDVSALRYPFNVVHCALLFVSSTSSSARSPSLQNTDVTAIPDPSTNKLTRRLMGTLVASPFVGVDPELSRAPTENSRLGCFFIFPDLSCRQHGLYKLRFTLMSLGAEITQIGGRAKVVDSVESDVFEVYSAKEFPGMRASTTLTRELKKQGAGVSVKKGNEGKSGKKKKRGNSSESEGSDSEGSVGGRGSKRKKS